MSRRVRFCLVAGGTPGVCCKRSLCVPTWWRVRFTGQVTWPPTVRKFLSYMSVFQFDLGLTAPEVRSVFPTAVWAPSHLKDTCERGNSRTSAARTSPFPVPLRTGNRPTPPPHYHRRHRHARP